MLAEEGSEQTRENILRDGGGNAEGEFAGEFAIAGAKGAFGVGDDGGDFFCAIEERGALAGEGSAAGGAVEEADAKVIFEGFDLQGYGGLGEEEMLGGFAEAEVFGDGAEDFEAEVFKMGHGDCDIRYLISDTRKRNWSPALERVVGELLDAGKRRPFGSSGRQASKPPHSKGRL